MTREEAIQVCKDVQSLYWSLSDKIRDAMGMAIEALEQPEQKKDKWHIPSAYPPNSIVSEEKLDQLGEKIQQLEKDVDRLKNSRTIEVRPTYPNITSTGISAYAGPEFNGVCYGLPTNAP